MKRLQTLSSLAVGLAFSTPLIAETNRWIGPASGDWAASSNWQLGAPIPSQSILIDGDPSQESAVHLLNSATLSNLHIDAGDRLAVHFQINTGKVLSYTGSTLFNAGTLALGDGVGDGYTVLSQDLTVSGGGTIDMNRGTLRGPGRVINLDNTIVGGGGGIGVFAPGMLNHGTLLSNRPNNSLTLLGNGTLPMQNRGTITATNGGYVAFSGQLGATFDNSGGIIRTVGNGVIQLDHNAVISGGTLSTDYSWAIIMGNDRGGLRDIYLNAEFEVYGMSTLSLGGQITNQKSIYTGEYAQQSNVIEVVAGGATLTGGGSVRLNAYGKLLGPGTLILNGNTIRGAGQVGGNTLALENWRGTIRADVSGQTMTIDPRPGTELLNASLMQVINGASMMLSGSGGGGFRNTGTILASNGTIASSSSAAISSISGNTLREGTWIVEEPSAIMLSGVSIRTNEARILLYGKNALFPAIQSLDLNRGTMSLQLSRDFTSASGLTNEGTFLLSNGSDLNVTGNLLLAPGSFLDLAVGGTTTEQFAQIHASGLCELNGTLRVSIENPFQPVEGRSYLIAEGSSRVGEFDVMLLPDLPGEFYFAPIYMPSAMYLEVRIPEPTLLLGSAAGTFLLLTRRRGR